jgi:hypothetical protein
MIVVADKMGLRVEIENRKLSCDEFKKDSCELSCTRCDVYKILARLMELEKKEEMNV